MKLIWEERDIKTGRKVIAINSHPGGEVWMIGYTPNPTEKGNVFALVSQADGLIGDRLSCEKMVERLNANAMWPVEWLK